MYGLSQTPIVTHLVVEAITPIDDAGHCTVTLGPAATGLWRDSGEPAEPDDVLSVQRDGSLEARLAGSCGSFERGLRDGDRVTYWPDAEDGGPGPRAFTFALVTLS